MLIRKLVASILLVSSPVFAASQLPYPPVAAEKFNAEAAPNSKLVRVKLSIFNSTNTAERNILLGGLVVCTKASCYKPPTQQYVDFTTTSNATNALSDFVMPPGVITHIYFEELASGVGIEGSIKLDNPLKIDQELPAAEILVVLAQRGTGNKMKYIPTLASTGLLDKQATSIYYVPGHATSKQLPMGAAITIPAGALDKPAIFSAAVRDVGAKFPQIDIYPYLQLKVPASLDVSPISRLKAAVAKDGPSPTPMPSPVLTSKAAAAAQLDTSLDGKVKISLPKTGVVNSATIQKKL